MARRKAPYRDLERYHAEALGQFEELQELRPRDDQYNLEAFVTQEWSALVPHLLAPPPEVFVFLGEGPTAQERRMAKKPFPEQALLWLQARAQVLQAAKALRLAADAEHMLGMSYRRAVRHMAEEAAELATPPSIEDLLWPEFGDETDGE